jgi:hypothetical protein
VLTTVAEWGVLRSAFRKMARVSDTEPTTLSRGVNLIPHREDGESVMSVVLTDLMLFVCLALFFTGIMIAGAILLG